MVGRTWFVSEESLRQHKENVLRDEIYRNRIENLKGKKSKNADSVVASQTVETPAKDETASKVEVALSETHPIVMASISYSSDDRPLLPELKKIEEAESVEDILDSASSSESDFVTPIAINVVEKMENTVSNTTKTYASIARSLILKRVLTGALVVALILGVGQVSYKFMVSDSNIVAENSASSSANIYSALGSVVSFIRDGFDGILAIFGHSPKLAINADGANVENSGGSDVQALKNPGMEGMAVVPSSGSLSADDIVKQKIQGSFSDQVEVSPDGSGTAGVIRPVFKQTKGRDFLYVMVPVKSPGPP